MNPETITLPNGLRIVVEPLPHTHSVSIGCFVGVGALYETAALSGVSHFIEHMCFKGTRNLPGPKQISYSIEEVGGMLDAETSYESTIYWAKVADIHVDRALHVLTELVRYPLFLPSDLEKERRVIIEELRGLQDSPGDWIDTLICEALWGEQPLGRDIAGSIASVSSINHQHMLDFWNQHYIASQMVISVAGNIARDRVVEAITEAFATCAAGSRQPAFPTLPPVSGPQVTLRWKDVEQSNFCIAFPGLAYTDPERRALDALDTVLGGGMSSRLFQELREERGLAYSVGSYHNKYADSGTWVGSPAYHSGAVVHCMKKMRGESLCSVPSATVTRLSKMALPTTENPNICVKRVGINSWKTHRIGVFPTKRRP